MATSDCHLEITVLNPLKGSCSVLLIFAEDNSTLILQLNRFLRFWSQEFYSLSYVSLIESIKRHFVDLIRRFTLDENLSIR